MSGIAPDVARRINLIARGHPLALGMATSIVLSETERTIEEAGLHQVIEALSRSYIEAVPDPITRRALEASSVVRCVTEPLLHALLPETPPRDTMERLAALPFVEPGREGLFIHDAVRSAIASSLATRDPDSHREYRRAAWAFLQNRLRLAHAKTEPWRYTADLLFLIQNPFLREGFFPSGPQPLALEPATPDDEPAVHQIVETAAPEREALFAWWRYHPDAFRIVRDRDGGACGLFVMIRASDLNEAVDASDPVAAAWRRDVVTAGPIGCALLPALARSGCRRSSVRVAGSLLGGLQAGVFGNARNAALGLHRDRQPRAVRRDAGQIGIPAACRADDRCRRTDAVLGHARHGTRIGRCLVDETGWSRNHGGGSRVFESARCRGP